MREYCSGGIRFVCLETEALAKKIQFQSLFYYAVGP